MMRLSTPQLDRSEAVEANFIQELLQSGKRDLTIALDSVLKWRFIAKEPGGSVDGKLLRKHGGPDRGSWLKRLDRTLN